MARRKLFYYLISFLQQRQQRFNLVVNRFGIGQWARGLPYREVYDSATWLCYTGWKNLRRFEPDVLMIADISSGL